MIEVKGSVAFVELHPGIRWACDVANALWDKIGIRCVVTAFGDSAHSDASFHYARPGDSRVRAVDLRKGNVPMEKREELLKNLRIFLGPCFQVIDETDHYHVEIDGSGLAGLD